MIYHTRGEYAYHNITDGFDIIQCSLKLRMLNLITELHGGYKKVKKWQEQWLRQYFK
jgi:hypothetical protein